jgi:hypothetical protein
MALSGGPADVQAEEDALQGHGGHADLHCHAATPALLVISTTAHQLQEGSQWVAWHGVSWCFQQFPKRLFVLYLISSSLLSCPHITLYRC